MAIAARPVFAIFEGGGAKGVAHIGALEALERNGLKVIGAAGTSAGALAATLAAVGLPARRIMDPTDPKRNLLADRGLDPPRLLGLPSWRAFRRLLWTLRYVALGAGVAGLFPMAILAFPIVWTVAGIVWRRGHFSTDPVARLLNDVLRERLAEVYAAEGHDAEVPERVTFQDLDHDRFKALQPLKIVATDITRGRLMVFDRLDTPHVVVAEAVAASIAIPLVFAPVSIESYDGGKSVFVDGGLVSNLPVWVFQEDKLAHERRNPTRPPVPIVGFTLDGEAPGSAAAAQRRRQQRTDAKTAQPGFWRQQWRRLFRPRAFELHLRSILNASLEGSQSLSHRFVEDLVVAPLETGLKMLDFDASWLKLRDGYVEGRNCADRHLRRALIVKPDRVRAELKRIEILVRRAMNRRRRRAGEPPLTRMRANLVERHGQRMFRVTHAFNMDLDADDRLPLDPDARGAPQAFRLRTLVLARIGASVSRGRVMTKYEQALVRQHVNTVICVPVFPNESAWERRYRTSRRRRRRPEPAGVFCLDSDQDLSNDFSDPHIRRLLAVESTLLFPALTLE